MSKIDEQVKAFEDICGPLPEAWERAEWLRDFRLFVLGWQACERFGDDVTLTGEIVPLDIRRMLDE